MRQRIDDEQIETIHVYMLREPVEPEDDEPEPRWPRIQWPTIAPMWNTIQHYIMASIACAMLVGFAFAPAGGPLFTIKTLRIPLVALPLQIFTASVNIVPTGVQQIPATVARGTLTIYNGSILQESLPAGFIVTSESGVEIATDQTVTIPPANLPEAGWASVPAHAVVAGAAGNIGAYSINQHDGADISIKNTSAFTGGQDASTRIYATSQDVNNATTAARQKVEANTVKGLLFQPCSETVSKSAESMSVTRSCQTYTYTLPKKLPILSIKRERNVIVVLYKAFE